VKPFVRVLAIATVGVVLLSGVASASVATKSKKVSTEKYAKTLCVNYTGATDAVNCFIDAYNGDTSDEAAAFQAEVISLGADLSAELARIEAKLKKVYPDIDDGKKIGKSFVAGITQVRTEIEGALTDFGAADPNGVAFAADISTLEVTINLLDIKRNDPFSELDDQDLLGAFDDEKACEDVVTIFGA
jgi:hypothetical protein